MWRSAISADWNYRPQYTISIVKSRMKSHTTSNHPPKSPTPDSSTKIRDNLWWLRRRSGDITRPINLLNACWNMLMHILLNKKQADAVLSIAYFHQKGPLSSIKRSWASKKDSNSKDFHASITTTSILWTLVSPPTSQRENILIHIYTVHSLSSLKNLPASCNCSETKRATKVAFTGSICAETECGGTSLLMISSRWRPPSTTSTYFSSGANKLKVMWRFGLLWFRRPSPRLTALI